MNAIASLSGVSVRAGRASLLDGVNLEVSAGDFVGVLGPNGSGKSTLLGLLNATRRPDAGSVQLLRTDPWMNAGENRRARLRARIGTMLQQCDSNRSIPLLARDVVAMGVLGCHRPAGGRQPGGHERIEAAMERLGIAGLRRRTYRSLSGGEQQKVQLARVMAQEPELLLLDEPTTGLDPDWQERMVELIDELGRDLRIPMIMTTHALAHLPRCCRRIVLLRAGRVLYDGPASRALSGEMLSELYGCRVDVVEHAGRLHCMARGRDAQ